MKKASLLISVLAIATCVSASAESFTSISATLLRPLHFEKKEIYLKDGNPSSRGGCKLTVGGIKWDSDHFVDFKPTNLKQGVTVEPAVVVTTNVNESGTIPKKSIFVSATHRMKDLSSEGAKASVQADKNGNYLTVDCHGMIPDQVKHHLGDYFKVEHTAGNKGLTATKASIVPLAIAPQGKSESTRKAKSVKSQSVGTGTDKETKDPSAGAGK